MSDTLPPSILNSPWSYLPEHFTSWVVVISIIIALIYTSIVITKEKSRFDEEGKWKIFKNLQMFIPSWWSLKFSNDQSMIFHRSDTHYDWFFEVSLVNLKTIEEAKSEFLKLNQIVLDLDVALISNQKNHLFINQDILNQIMNFYRIESTGTEKQEDRIYLDATWIEIANGNIFQFISKSSVLNGGIEGPYAEEVLKRLSFSLQKTF